ncbi:hypothetical protein MKW98_016923 [Papaver atlanticum]|uniref:Uncharacterized protein n=1 Tax=Papaver atlanticum TaxID=357466 RepID=A0AAD4THF0_9MAGN|nr:hypothetical protein MKW98_016923 [Papaver atlanticum]
MTSLSKKQWVCNFTTIRMVVALILCLLLLGGVSYSIEAAAGRINIATREVINYKCTTVIEGRCVDDQDCTTLCRLEKYLSGICEPNDKDEEPLGLCCCLN